MNSKDKRTFGSIKFNISENEGLKISACAKADRRTLTDYCRSVVIKTVESEWSKADSESHPGRYARK